MKTALILITLLFLFSCGDSESDDLNNGDINNGETGGTVETIADFECSSVFSEADADDYSTACFPEMKLPTFTYMEIDQATCQYKIGMQEMSNDPMVVVNITEGDAEFVATTFSTIRSLGSQNSKDISGLGHEAFLDENGSGKVLQVRYKNIILAFSVQDNTPSPCTFADAELEKFAKLVIENLD